MTDEKPTKVEQVQNKAARLLLKLIIIGGLLVVFAGAAFAGGIVTYKQFFEEDKKTEDTDSDKTSDQLCKYNGKEYSNGSKFTAEDKCNQCSCEKGTLSCTKLDCSVDVTPTADCTDDYYPKSDFPIVYYEREGLLSDAEKTEFETRLIDPYTDYHADLDDGLIAIVIEAPADTGTEFIVTGLFSTGVHEGFLYGVRGTALPWWVPTCMDTCHFSDEFRAKYPEIIELSE